MSGLGLSLPRRFSGLGAKGGLVLVGAMYAVVLGFAVGSGRLELLALVLSSIVFVLAIGNPYATAMVLIGAALLLQPAIDDLGVPGGVEIVGDVLSAALVLAMLLAVARRPRSVTWPMGTRWLVLFGFAVLFSAAISREGIVLVLLGIRTTWKFVPLFFAPSVFRWSAGRLRAIVWLVLGFALVQGPVAIVQYLAFGSASGDPMGGTLGNTASGLVTSLMIAMATLVIGMWVYGYGKRLLLAGALGLLCVGPALNETKVFFVVAPIVWCAVLLPKVHRRPGPALAMLVLVCLSIFLVYQSYSALYSHGRSARALTENALVSQTSSGLGEGGVVKRLPQLSLAVTLVGSDPTGAVFGLGAGSLMRSNLVGEGGSLVTRFGERLRNPVYVVRLFLESGAVAVVTLAGLLIWLYRRGSEVERLSSDSFWRAMGFAQKGIVVTMALMSFYAGTFAADALSAVFWGLTGVFAAQALRLRDEEPTVSLLDPGNN